MTAKRKRGGQPGNQNAKGGRGNPHPNPPPKNTKHGAYSKVLMDQLTPEELEALENMPLDIETLLTDQIKLYTIRERRIMQAINIYRSDIESLYTSQTTRTETNRDFATDQDKLLYESIQRKKIDKGELLPGKPYTMQTQQRPVIEIIARLEQELTTVSMHKLKAIQSLASFRAGQDQGTKESSLVQEWIKAVKKNRETRN